MQGSLFDRFTPSPETEDKMREGKQVENIIQSLAELAENVTRHDHASFALNVTRHDHASFALNVTRHDHPSFAQNEDTNSFASHLQRPFGRQKSVHHLLGGGASADVFLWRNRTISGSVLGAATAIWILFEWLNYNFLSIVCFLTALVMLGQFLWSNASGLLNTRSHSAVPRLVLPEELFVKLGKSIGAEANRGLGYLQDISCGGNLKQFLVALASLVASAILGTWCSFLTILYLGFVGAHILPVLYEKYQDEIDGVLYNLLGQIQNRYQAFDARVLSKMPTRNFGRKRE